MFQHLLVALDGSEMSQAAVPIAADLARGAGARVTLLHVLERDAPRTVHGQRHLTRRDEAEAYLAQVAAGGAFAGVSVSWHVHEEHALGVAESLAWHVEELGPDLIVMRSHGRLRMRDRLVGNVAQQAARQRAAPVLLLQAPAGEPVRFPFRRILVPLDATGEHEQGLAPAADLARLGEGTVLLMTVVRTHRSLAPDQAATGTLLPRTTREILDLRQRQAVEYLQGHVERLRQDGLEASGRVARGDPAGLIAQTARQDATDLVALGTHGKAGTDAFWSGSLGPRLIRRVKASFLLAPVPRGR